MCVYARGAGGDDDLLRVQPAEEPVFHHPGQRGGTCLQEKGFLNPAKYLSSLHRFLLLTGTVKQ